MDSTFLKQPQNSCTWQKNRMSTFIFVLMGLVLMCMIVERVFQAQKELLDTEMDLYKKTQAGEDTAQLKIKYTQLQLEALTTNTYICIVLYSNEAC